MPGVNEVIYAKRREHGGHHCTYVLLSINHDMEFLVAWFNHPKWGEQVVPHHLIQGTGLAIHQGIGNISKKNHKQRKGRNKNNAAMMY
eukprot:7117979-Ditylum_brightwellii.AAC.1